MGSLLHWCSPSRNSSEWPHCVTINRNVAAWLLIFNLSNLPFIEVSLSDHDRKDGAHSASVQWVEKPWHHNVCSNNVLWNQRVVLWSWIRQYRNGPSLELLDWLLYNSLTSHESCLLTPYTCAKEILLKLDTLCHGGKGSACPLPTAQLRSVFFLSGSSNHFNVYFVLNLYQHACCPYPCQEWTLNVWTAKLKVGPKKKLASGISTYRVYRLCDIHDMPAPCMSRVHRTSFCSVCRVGFNIAADDTLISARALKTILHALISSGAQIISAFLD